MVKKKEPAEQKILLGRPRGTLKMGLVGLPNVGKSTSFNFLSKQAVPADNFPFCTINPHEARISVPDERFVKLCEIFKPRSSVAATLSLFDIAGLVPGAHKGEGLGNAFLSHIGAVDGIFQVVRVFEDDDIIHTEGDVNPVNDLQTIADELRLKDIDRCEKLVDEAAKVVARNGKDKAKKFEFDVLTSALQYMQNKKWISDGNWKAAEVEVLNEVQFLTSKPVVYLVNMSEKDFIRQKNKWLVKIHNWVQENNPGPVVPYSANFETKLGNMANDEERKNYIKDVGASKSMTDKIVKTGYSTLNLIHFFTCGEDEVKCWTIRQHCKAPQAAGAIHTDFERGFICAEVYKFDDLIEHGSETAVKAAGKYHQKGKDYEVEDGDIIFFKFNVTNSAKK